MASLRRFGDPKLNGVRRSKKFNVFFFFVNTWYSPWASTSSPEGVKEINYSVWKIEDSGHPLYISATSSTVNYMAFSKLLVSLITVTEIHFSLVYSQSNISWKKQILGNKSDSKGWFRTLENISNTVANIEQLLVEIMARSTYTIILRDTL